MISYYNAFMLASQCRWLQGGVIFFPYLVLYLAAWALRLPVALVNQLFLVIHVLVALYVGRCFVYAFRTLDRYDWLFWIAILLFFWIPGASVEFPLDSWDHWQRIFAWGRANYIHEHGMWYRFTYFWGWSLLGGTEIPNRRFFIDLYSTFWQFYLAIQVYWFARRLGFDRAWSYLQTIGVIFLWGYFHLSWFRHESLSYSHLAYIAYLQVLIIFLDLLERKKTQVFLLLPLGLIMGFNHIQELALTVVSGFFLLLYWSFQRLSRFQRSLALAGISLFTILSLVFGYYVMAFDPSLFGNVPIWEITALGNFDIRSVGFTPFFTAQLHGYLGWLSALLIIRKYPQISVLSLGPLYLLLCPISVIILGHIFDLHNHHTRLLFAIPLSIPLLLGVKGLVHRLSPWLQYLVSFGLLVWFSSQPYNPRFGRSGRLFFQVYEAQPYLTLAHLDQTAIWLKTHRPWLIDGKCRIIADAPTQYVISTHLSVPKDANRVTGEIPPFEGEGSTRSFYENTERNGICAVLVPIWDQMPPFPVSILRKHTELWGLKEIGPEWLKRERLEEIERIIIKKGWSKSFVPPFFHFYEPTGK